MLKYAPCVEQNENELKKGIEWGFCENVASDWIDPYIVSLLEDKIDDE